MSLPQSEKYFGLPKPTEEDTNPSCPEAPPIAPRLTAIPKSYRGSEEIGSSVNVRQRRQGLLSKPLASILPALLLQHEKPILQFSLCCFKTTLKIKENKETQQ